MKGIGDLILMGTIVGVGYFLFKNLQGQSFDPNSPMITTGPALPAGCDPVLGCPKDVNTPGVYSSPNIPIGQTSQPPMQGAPPGYQPSIVQQGSNYVWVN